VFQFASNDNRNGPQARGLVYQEFWSGLVGTTLANQMISWYGARVKECNYTRYYDMEQLGEWNTSDSATTFDNPEKDSRIGVKAACGSGSFVSGNKNVAHRYRCKQDDPAAAIALPNPRTVRSEAQFPEHSYRTQVRSLLVTRQHAKRAGVGVFTLMARITVRLGIGRWPTWR